MFTTHYRQKIVVLVSAAILVLLVRETARLTRDPIFRAAQLKFKSDKFPCKWYEYDPVDWTMKIKEDMTCLSEPRYFNSIPKDVLKGKIIKRVLYANGLIENRGCTNETKKCTEAAHYDNQLNKTINYPPCCRQQILNTLNHVTTELQRLNVSHFIAYGNMIGYLRNKQYIPTDHDFDIMLENDFMLSKRFDEFLDLLKAKYGHVVEYPRNVKNGRILGKKVWMLSSRLNRNIGDIWPYHVRNESGRLVVDVSSSDGVNQPYDNVFPLNRVLFNGFHVLIPRKPKEYIEVQYGENGWQKKMTCKKVYDGNCLN